MKKTLLVAFLPFLLLASCGQEEEGTEDSSVPFTAFDGKSFNLESLEEELITNWTEDDDIYEGCKTLSFEGFSSYTAIDNLCANPDVQNILENHGEQFIYEMTHVRHLIYQDVVAIIEASGTWEKNYYAISGSNNKDAASDKLVPIYFHHYWWRYDDWKYNHSGEYGWENSDVGKRVLSTLHEFDNSQYSIYLSAYVEKGSYSSQNCTYLGNAYLAAGVTNKSNNRTAYAVYNYNMAHKTIWNAKALTEYEFWSWNADLIRV